MNTPMQCLECHQKRWVHDNGNLSSTFDKATMKAKHQHKLTAFQWTKCLQTAARRTKYTLKQQQKLPRLNEPTQPLSTSLSAMQQLIKDWRSNSLRTLLLSAKMVGWFNPKPLQVGAVEWYHHYLQHPGHTRLEETMNSEMYWKGIGTTIRPITRSC